VGVLEKLINILLAVSILLLGPGLAAPLGLLLDLGQLLVHEFEVVL